MAPASPSSLEKAPKELACACPTGSQYFIYFQLLDCYNQGKIFKTVGLFVIHQGPGAS